MIAEIETDKATMEVEAVDEGSLTEILIPEGTENVKVNTPIAVIGEADARPLLRPRSRRPMRRPRASKVQASRLRKRRLRHPR